MHNIVLVILLIIAVALILIVLMQRSEGGGLGIGGGGGNMSGRPPASPLAKVTWALGVAFMVASLALTVIANRDSGSTSLMDGAAATDDSGARPSPFGGDLLPPAPEPDDTQPAAPDPTQPPSSE